MSFQKLLIIYFSNTDFLLLGDSSNRQNNTPCRQRKSAYQTTVSMNKAQNCCSAADVDCRKSSSANVATRRRAVRSLLVTSLQIYSCIRRITGKSVYGDAFWFTGDSPSGYSHHPV